MDTPHCIHTYLKVHFRPDTGLDSYDSLQVGRGAESSSGWRSQKMPFTSSWHVLELSGRSPPPERCCHLCNPDLLEEWKAPPPNDDRLTAFASDFIFPPKASAATNMAAEVSASAGPPIGLVNRYYPARCTMEDEQDLVTRLERWRLSWHEVNGGPYSTPSMVLNNRQSQGIVKAGNTFCRADTIDVKLMRSVVTLDTASDAIVTGVVEVVKGWVKDVASRGQPPSASGREKKKRKSNPKRRRGSPSSSTTTSPFPSPSKPKEKRKPLQPLPIRQPNLPRPTPAPGSPNPTQPKARPNYNTRLRNRNPPTDRARTPADHPQSPQNVDLFSPGTSARSQGTTSLLSESQVTLVSEGSQLSDSQAAASVTQASQPVASGSQPLRSLNPASQASPVPPPHAHRNQWELYPYHPIYNPIGLPMPNAAAYWQHWERQRQLDMNGHRS